MRTRGLGFALAALAIGLALWLWRSGERNSPPVFAPAPVAPEGRSAPGRGAPRPAASRVEQSPAPLPAVEAAPTPTVSLSSAQVTWIPAVHAKVLHVVDASSGEHLPQVTVVAAPVDGYLHPNLAHPGEPYPEEVLAQGDASPLTLARDAIYREWGLAPTVWVTAPGYQWRSTRLDYLNPAAVTIELGRAGRLLVHVQGEPSALAIAADGEGVLRLRTSPDPRGGTQRFGEVRAETILTMAQPWVLEGLPPGDYQVTVEIPVGPFEEPLILAREDVTLAAGDTVSPVLRLRHQAEPQRSPLGGTLRVPREWGDVAASLDFLSLDRRDRRDRHIKLRAMAPVSGSPDLYRWRLDDVTSGRYRINCDAFGSGWVIDTETQGRDGIELEVAPPAAVTVQVVEQTSGGLVRDSWVSWSATRRVASALHPNSDTTWSEARLAHEFRAPQGTIALWHSHTAYRATEELIFDIRPGENRLTIEVERIPGIRLHAHEDGATMELSTDLAQVVCVSGPGSGTVIMDDEPGVFLGVSAPGRYRVTLPPQGGNFQEISAFEVDVPRDTVVEVVVELSRRW